jgi:hypothetical protein
MIEEIALDPAGKTRFRYPAERAEWCKLALSGMRYETLLPSGFTARRILDLGAQEGAFACWAARRFPRAWVDLVEEDPELRALATENMPPGAKVLSIETGAARIRFEDYQLVRVGMNLRHDWSELGRVKGLTIFDFCTLSEEEAMAENEKRAGVALKKMGGVIKEMGGVLAKPT